MARLIAAVVTDDAELKREVTRLLRDGSTPIGVADDRAGTAGASADLVIVDGRDNLRNAIGAVERARAASASASIFLVASESSSDMILQSMRAGGTEFLVWPFADKGFDCG